MDKHKDSEKAVTKAHSSLSFESQKLGTVNKKIIVCLGQKIKSAGYQLRKLDWLIKF